MDPRPALAVVMVLLGGCTSVESPTPVGAPPGPTSTPSPSGNATNPSGNASADAGTAWVRDTWGAAQQLPLLDAKTTVENDVTTSAINCPFSCTDGFLLLPTDKLVPPGTASVLLTATWTAPGTAPTMVMNLFWRTASDAAPQQAEVKSTQPFEIKVEPKDWDAPMQKLSHWWFDLFPTSSAADAIPPLDVQVKVVAVRGAELPSIPEPKDPWASGSSVVLHQADARKNLAWRIPMVSNACIDCQGFFWESVGPGLVAPGAAKVQAKLSWDWPGPTKPALWYSDFVNDKGVAMAVTQDGDKDRTFEVAVPPELFDSPYQSRSSWVFFILYDTQGQNGGAIDGSMSLDAVALKG
jgi:hypothetical protein